MRPGLLLAQLFIILKETIGNSELKHSTARFCFVFLPVQNISNIYIFEKKVQSALKLKLLFLNADDHKWKTLLLIHLPRKKI